jgi:predicted RNase H-like HicB family nuclease
MRTACLWQLAPLCLDVFPRAEPAAEATQNIREAIEGYLKGFRKHGDALPPYFK